ncbi:hypothetical protein KEJ26_06595 [Candidatus Bathyarchaeota archaeon]|nr:hypothetical protein [Candidatus Bathyarchaeota archaeon]
MEFGKSLNSIRYRYKEDGILPDGSRLADIPIMKLMLVRRDIGKAIVGEAIADTGFDESLYANIQLVEFLEGLRSIRTATLRALGHEVACEVFKAQCHLVDDNLRPVLNLQEVEVYVPINVEDLLEDVIVGRSILNQLKLQLNGEFLQVL